MSFKKWMATLAASKGFKTKEEITREEEEGKEILGDIAKAKTIEELRSISKSPNVDIGAGIAILFRVQELQFDDLEERVSKLETGKV